MLTKALVSMGFLFFAGTGRGAPPTQPSSSASSPTAASARGDAATLKEDCVRSFQRERTCTDEFIPALVATRVKLNKPPGLKERDKKEGREALVKKAKAEWAVDSQDDRISATCDQIVASSPPDQLRAQMVRASACVAKPACAEFVDCIMPIVATHLR